MAHVDDQRVARVLDALEAQHPGAQLLVNDPWSIYYLTGFYADMFERFCGVLLARGNEPVILVNALHQLPEYDNARVAYHTDTDVVADAIAREIDPTKPLGIDTVMRSGFLMPLMERHATSEFSWVTLPSPQRAPTRMPPSRSSCARPRPLTTP